MNNWKTLKLNQISELITRGITPSYTEEEGVTVINQKCIRNNTIDYTLTRKTDPNRKKINENKYLKSYDVLINSTGVGTLGRVGQIKEIIEPITVDSHITIVRGKEDIVFKPFLGYALFNLQSLIEDLGHGSTGQTELSRIILGESVDILIPPLPTQRRIAGILSALDDKIENNRKTSDTLEQIAQAVFKRWFMDFDFPDEQGRPYKSSGGKMVECELGLIPEGWDIGRLGDYAKVKSGFAFKSKWWRENGVPVIKIKSIQNKTINMNEVGYVSEDKIDLAKEFIVNGGDLLIAMTGATIGKMGIVPEYDSKILVNQRVGKFFLGDNPYEKISYLFCLLHQKNVYEKIVGRGDGSAQPNVSPSQIESITVVQPPREIINQFNKAFMNNFKMWTKLLKENELLKQTRDTLLPKLMSGEVEV